MDDRGAEIDERAAAALKALSEGRASPTGADPARAGSPWWASMARVVDELGGVPRRVAVPAIGVLVVGVIGALAWIGLRPVGAPEADGGDLFSGSAVTVPGSSAIDGGAGGGGALTTTTTAVPVIVVHAAGAVNRPGLYRLPRDSRVADLLEAAGGPTLETDLDRLNLAAPLADGQRLYVPRRGEPSPAVVGPEGGGVGGGGGASPGGSAGPVDLNTATAEELDILPGVGPATAAAIVAHRERNGPFADVDGLLDVRGIGPAKLEALRDLVTVG